MKPEEIVSMAAELNAAIPGLVPAMNMERYEWTNNYEFLSVDIDSVVSDQHEMAHRGDHIDVFSIGLDPVYVASLMLGRTDAWLANNLNHPARAVVVPINVKLLTYVASTLPGVNG